jgi:putative transposase
MPGHCYVVTTVIRDRRPLLSEPALASIVAAEMRRSMAENRATPWAWVVMPDHVHWMLQLGRASLQETVQAFKSRSARAINLARLTHGSVWQAGYHDRCVGDEHELQSQMRYVVTNPLRRGLASTIEDYPHWWCRWPLRTEDLD